MRVRLYHAALIADTLNTSVSEWTLRLFNSGTRGPLARLSRNLSTRPRNHMLPPIVGPIVMVGRDIDFINHIQVTILRTFGQVTYV